MTRCPDSHRITVTLTRSDLEDLRSAVITAKWEGAIPDDEADALCQALQDALDAHDATVPHDETQPLTEPSDTEALRAALERIEALVMGWKATTTSGFGIDRLIAASTALREIGDEARRARGEAGS